MNKETIYGLIGQKSTKIIPLRWQLPVSGKKACGLFCAIPPRT